MSTMPPIPPLPPREPRFTLIHAIASAAVALGVAMIKWCIDWIMTPEPGGHPGVQFILAFCGALIGVASGIAMQRWWAKS